jgi:hypothetical protein
LGILSHVHVLRESLYEDSQNIPSNNNNNNNNSFLNNYYPEIKPNFMVRISKKNNKIQKLSHHLFKVGPLIFQNFVELKTKNLAETNFAEPEPDRHQIES